MENSFPPLVGEELASSLEARKITKPTPVQSALIPLMLENRDVIASAETGTGKTLAYLLPIYKRLDMSVKAPQAFIITPTHELSAQVYKQAELLMKDSAALLIGGADINRQIARLKQKPRVIVGSAARIIELTKMKKLTAHYVKTIVLDEADRLIIKDNYESTEALIKLTQRDRQIAAVSASISSAAKANLEKIINKPDIKIISLTGEKPALNENVEHIYYIAEKRDKIKALRKIAHSETGKRAIIFVNDPYDLKTTAERLNYHGLKAVALFGDMHKSERQKALNAFREGRANFLVTSDLSSRGLDISGVLCIINADVPENNETYLHRAGRTGRMGESGKVITLVTEREQSFLANFEKSFGIKIGRSQ